MSRKPLSKKELKQLGFDTKKSKKISCTQNLRFCCKKKNAILVEEEIKYLIINKEIPYFFYKDKLVPTLKNELKNKTLPEIVIDMPAVKFIAGGADVMRPGIKEISNFKKDEFVLIVDENHKKPLAIGQSLFNSEEMKTLKKGKVIKNIHHVGDKIWKLN